MTAVLVVVGVGQTVAAAAIYAALYRHLTPMSDRYRRAVAILAVGGLVTIAVAAIYNRTRRTGA